MNATAPCESSWVDMVVARMRCTTQEAEVGVAGGPPSLDRPFTAQSSAGSSLGRFFASVTLRFPTIFRLALRTRPHSRHSLPRGMTTSSVSPLACTGQWIRTHDELIHTLMSDTGPLGSQCRPVPPLERDQPRPGPPPFLPLLPRYSSFPSPFKCPTRHLTLAFVLPSLRAVSACRTPARRSARIVSSSSGV